MREKWLNGWPRFPNNGRIILIGAGAHCIGCGKFQGIACVAFSDDYVPPEKLPDYPFEEITCPICILDVPETKEDKLTARLLALQRKQNDKSS